MELYEEHGYPGLQAASPPSQSYSEQLQVGAEADTTKMDPGIEVPAGVAQEGFWRQHRYWVLGVVVVVVIGVIAGGAVGGVLSARGNDPDNSSKRGSVIPSSPSTSASPSPSSSPSPTMLGTATPVAMSEYSYPTPVSWGSQHLFVLGVNGSRAVRSATTWYGNRIDSWGTSNTLESFGGTTHQDLHHITAICRKSRTIDMYLVGPNSGLYRKWYNSTWHPVGWELKGGMLLSTPSIASWSQERRDLFAIGSDYGLWQMYADGEGDHKGWFPLGGNWSTYAPTVVSREKNTLDILLVGPEDRALYVLSWDGSSWSSFTRVGGYCTSRPAAASWSSKRIDVVVRGGDGGLWHNSYDAGTKVWSNWTSISGGTQVQAEPDAVSWGERRLGIFAWGADRSLLYKSFDGKTWTPSSGFETLGSDLSGPPKAVSDAATSLHVFGYGRKGNIVHRQWNETTKEWLPKEGFHDIGTP